MVCVAILSYFVVPESDPPCYKGPPYLTKAEASIADVCRYTVTVHAAFNPGVSQRYYNSILSHSAIRCRFPRNRHLYAHLGMSTEYITFAFSKPFRGKVLHAARLWWSWFVTRSGSVDTPVSLVSLSHLVPVSCSSVSPSCTHIPSTTSLSSSH